MEFEINNNINKNQIDKNKKLLDQKLENREKKLKENINCNINNGIIEEENSEFIKNKIEKYKINFYNLIHKVKNSKSLSEDNENSLRNYLTEIQNYINDIDYCLSSFYQKYFKEQYISLETDFNQILKEFKKKKKFGFNKNKIKNFNVQESKNDNIINNISLQSLNIKGIENLVQQNMIIKQNELEEIYKIENIKNSNIEINGITKVLYMKNIQNSIIKIGPTLNSVFIDEVINSNIHIAGHQIRIHNSFDSIFNVFTTSKLIIEKSKKIVFNEYKYTYEEFNKDFEKCNFNNKNNLWQEVQDFDWIKKEKSPNYCINK